MATTTTYPGVYIEEDASPALSVAAGATAVPIISLASWTDGVMKFNSYFEFSSYVGGDSTVVDKYADIKAYFECGGGPCYVSKSADLIASVPMYSDITLIVAAGDTTITTTAISSICGAGSGRFAILDVPSAALQTDGSLKPDGTSSAGFDAAEYAAAYYPALSASWSTNNISASSVLAGIYCMVDRTRGVWKAPANVVIPSNYAPVTYVTDDLQGSYNTGKAINMIRAVDSRGPVVWGARTLDDSDDWRYVPVRRLFDSAERDIGTSMQTMMFEPNNQPTWEKVRTAVTNYLHNLWRRGALAGATETDAYFVVIGENVTMTADDIANGKMIAQVGMAAVRPAEFIVLQFTQNMTQV